MFIENFTDEELFEIRLTLEPNHFDYWFENNHEYENVGWVTVRDSQIARYEALQLNEKFYFQIRNYYRLLISGKIDYYYLITNSRSIRIADDQLAIIKQNQELLFHNGIELNPEAYNVH